jgi:probable rRNA maturation factor
MIHIQVAETIEATESYIPDHSFQLEQAAAQALHYADAGLDADVTVMLSDDLRMQEINRQFLGIDAPTDVLAFPGGDIDPDTQAVYLGDIVISYPRALAQSSSVRHTVQDELQLLAVHGMLHLLGYDHAEPQDRAVMWAAQAEILAQLGCQATLPPD